MRIFNIVKSPNFTAGKVQVYSDFDETYCPVRHPDLHTENYNDFMRSYCSKMDNFFKSTEGDLHFHITTGRTFGEYEAVSKLLKIREYPLPFPESFIAKNGSDEYIKKGADSDFYEKGIFPYQYSEPNKAKEQEIKKITNWDGAKIKAFIRNLADKYHLRMVEGDSEHSVKDNGESSLYSEGKLNPDEWRKLPNENGAIINHEQPIADYVIGARKDGNLKVNLIFSPDYGYCPERNFIYDNFMSEIKTFLNDNSIKYDMQWETPNMFNKYSNHCNITPQIEGGALTKLYDTKKALKEAIENNDIVIAAGDGPNDFDMLNPLEYLENEDWNKFKENSTNKEFYEKNNFQKLYDLKDALTGKNDELKKELEQNGFFKKIKEMPIYSIIIKKEDSELGILKDIFGQFNKVIEVNNSELKEGIENVIKIHSQNNKSFKEAMSDKFQSFIFGEVKKNRITKNLIIGGITGTIIGVSGFLIHKNKNNNLSVD